MKYSFIFCITILFLFTETIPAKDTRNFNTRDFTAVDVGWGMHVKVSQADNYSIEVTAEEKDFKYLKVEKNGSKLKIYIDKKNYHTDDDIYISILMPELTAISLHGGADGNIDMNVREKQFSADLSGGAQLKGDVKCSDIELNLSGGSQVSLNGNAGNMSANGSGGSIFKLKNLAVKNVDAELSGGSIVYVKMDGRLNVDASGGSQLKYYGSATIGKMDFSGGAGITEGD